MSKELYLTLKKFWPHRSEAKGFSIQKTSCQYRSKISSVSSNEILNQNIDDNNLKSIEEEGKRISITNISIKRTHWANRDFSEYTETA